MKELKGNANLSVGLLYLIWPFLVLVESIRNYRESWAKNGIWLFVIFFAFTFVPRSGNDSMGMAERLTEFHNADLSLSQVLGMVYTHGSRYLDVIQLLITFLVSKFSNDYRILFGIFGVLFGFFYSRNIWSLITATEGKLGTVEIILLLLFSLLIPMWYINGVRFWTAAHIFIYGALQVLLYKNTRGYLIGALSILMHFSYVFPVVLLGAYLVIGNRTRIYFAFFIVSLIISGLDPILVRDTLLNYAPDILHNRISSYTNLDEIERGRLAYANANFYARWYLGAIKIGISSLLILVFLAGKEYWKEKNVINLYSFALFFTGFTNLTSTVSSMGRFSHVANLVSVASMFMFYYALPRTHSSRKWFYLATPFLVFYAFTMVRLAMDNTGVLAFISNPIFAPFLANKLALIDLIR